MARSDQPVASSSLPAPPLAAGSCRQALLVAYLFAVALVVLPVGTRATGPDSTRMGIVCGCSLFFVSNIFSCEREDIVFNLFL